MEKNRTAFLFGIVPAVLLIALTGTYCTSSQKIARAGYSMRQLAQADSLFRTGNYELAKLKYLKIRETSRSSTARTLAQYYLGYVNIYYDNPFADYEAALREFKRFASDYPNNEHIEEVNNWIRLLTAMQNFDTNYQGNVSKLHNLSSKEQNIAKNYATLQNEYLKCEILKDSLINRIKILEGVIEKLGTIE